MNSSSRYRFVGIKLLFAVMLLFIVLLTMPSEVRANEIMTDRCSGDVAFVPNYDDGPRLATEVPGWVFPSPTYILTRGKSDSIEWSIPFSVTTDDSGRIRWWCNSTAGNWADPGTWRIDGGYIGSKCTESGCKPTADLTVTPQSSDGWTAERSRCSNRSSKIRARLGSGRLLQIECLDTSTGTSSSRLTINNCSYGPDTCIQGFVWREATPSDHVCVTSATREQVRNDNAAAVQRRSPNGGLYGADTCRQGYVWREAFPGDHACVTPATRKQALFDNGRKSARIGCR
jgi:hypothetical protein